MTSYTGTVPTFLAGELPDADKFTELSNLALAETDVWDDYSGTFTVTGSVSNPTKGNSTYLALKRQVGKLVEVVFKVTIGSTWGVGSGDYRFLLPVAASGNGQQMPGHGFVQDTGTAYKLALVTYADSTHAILILDGSGGALGSTGPGTAWATNDEIRGTLRYLAA